MAGGGYGHGVRGRNRRVRLRADEPALGDGRACPGQNDGGYVEQFARRGGALPVLIALAATLAKLVDQAT